MSLADLQRATVRLLMDRDFEKRVREQGHEAFESYALTDAERNSLLELDPERFGFNAWAVRTKRGQLFWMCMPARLRSAGLDALGISLMTRFTEQLPHVGLHPWPPTLARALHWLAGPEGAAHGATPLLQGLALYEKLRVLLPCRSYAPRPPPDVRSHLRFAPHATIAQFPLNVSAVLQLPAEKWAEVPLTPTTLCVSNERQGLFVLPASRILRVLHSLADGTRPLPELITAVRAALNDESDAVVTALASLSQRGLLEPVDLWTPQA